MRAYSLTVAKVLGCMSLAVLAGCFSIGATPPGANAPCATNDSCPSGYQCLSGKMGVSGTFCCKDKNSCGPTGSGGAGGGGIDGSIIPDGPASKGGAIDVASAGGTGGRGIDSGNAGAGGSGGLAAGGAESTGGITDGGGTGSGGINGTGGILGAGGTAGTGGGANGGTAGIDAPFASDVPALDGRPLDGADAPASNPDIYVAIDRPDSSDGRADSYIPSPDLPDASDDIGPPPDVTPPDTSLTSTPPTLTNNATPAFAFASTEPGTFECQMDTASATTCSSPYTAAALSEGRHVFTVTAIDLAGNRDPSPATFAFTIDVTAPDTDVRGWPLPTTGKYAVFAFTSSDSKAGFECSLDSTDVWESCISPKQYVLTSDGSHTFRVRAVDMAGNRDASPASATFKASLALPTLFPDSSTIFCTDGTAKVDCPLAAASGWGQDGTYLINRPQYTSSAGTVTDAITGLTWEQGNAPVGTWDTQVARCTSLSTKGYTDWRLPSRLEALTIIDAGRVQPALDVTVFATTSPSNYFWLGQEIDGVPTAAWLSDWLDANLSWNGKNAQYSAKCVRGPTLSGTLTSSASGLVVNDSRTNLTWQRTVNGSTYTWLDALSYCNALTLDSGTGWRLPTVKELQTLINVGAGLNPPEIPSVFPSGNAVEMWTSSPNPATPSSNYTVNMLNGAGGSQPTSKQLQVRCVR